MSTTVFKVDPETEADFIACAKKSAYSWHWITGKNGRIRNVRITHDGRSITSLSFDGNHAHSDVVSVLIATLNKQTDRRKHAAEKAALTRKQRHERDVYQIAKVIFSGGTTRNSLRCHLCRKPITDPESQARGIGSDCWQAVLSKVNELVSAIKESGGAE